MRKFVKFYDLESQQNMQLDLNYIVGISPQGEQIMNGVLNEDDKSKTLLIETMSGRGHLARFNTKKEKDEFYKIFMSDIEIV